MSHESRLLIVGAGGFGRQVSELARTLYDCAFLDDGYAVPCSVCGISVIGDTSDMQALFGEYGKLLVTIGDNKVREMLLRHAESIGYEIPDLICPSAYVSPFASIGKGCVILNNACVQNGAVVGDGVVLHPGVEVHHDACVDDFAMVYTNSCVRSMAYVGKRAWIDSTITISNSSRIDDDGVVVNPV